MSLVSQDANVAGTVSFGDKCIIQQTAEVVGLLGRKKRKIAFSLLFCFTAFVFRGHDGEC